MRIFSILIGLIYASVCLAQINTAALEGSLNFTFAEVVDGFPYLDECHVIEGDVDNCVILNDEQAAKLEEQRAEKLILLNETRLARGLEPLEELPIPTFKYLKIDSTYTNFDLGRVKASLFSQTKPLDSNSNRETGVAEPIKIAADLITDLTDTDDGRKLFTATADVSIDGNTMSVLKFVAQVYGECEIKDTSDASPKKNVLDNIICGVMDGFRAADRVVDLQKSIQTAANAARDAYGDDADSIIGEIFSSLKIETVGDELVLSFEIETGENELTADITDNLKANVVMTVKESGINLRASGNALLEIRQVDDFTSKVKEIATELIDVKSDTHVKQYADNLYFVFGVLEAFLIVEEEEDGDDDFGDDDF